MSIILRPNKSLPSFLYNIRKSTVALQNISLDDYHKKRLNFLMHINEQNIGLQKISYNSNYIYDTSIFKKGNPFFFIRKNYKKLFWNFLQTGFLTPNLLKFLHAAYWPTNNTQAWRTFYIYHGLERKQRVNYIKPKINKLTYFFSLIFKKNYIQSLLHFKSFIQSKLKNKYFNQLKYYYHLNINKLKFQEEFFIKPSKKKKSKTFIITDILNKYKYFKTPKFIIKERSKKEFKNFFFLTFRQRIFLKNLITFYYPVISFRIKEHNIHSLPMKTKKPRRV